MTHDSKTPHEDIYETVTRQIIEAIEAGATSWRLPWYRTGGGPLAPINVDSRAGYRGINLVCLWAAAASRGFESGTWGTYRQWQKRGAQVRRGERATEIVFWKVFERSQPRLRDEEDEESGRSRGIVAKGYSVFNADQVDGYEPPQTPTLSEAERIADAEAFFRPIPADIRHGSDSAFYAPDGDFICLPRFENFRTSEHYYGVLAHELTHWTGAGSRLARNLTGRFGSQAYAAEELVAELGAAFLASGLGLSLSVRDDHASYIGSWLKLLRDDKKAIFTAASRAQQAVDYLMTLRQGATLEAA